MDNSEQPTSFYEEDKQFLSRSFISKGEFSKEYGRVYHDKSRAEELLSVIVTELEKAVLDGNVDDFKHLSKLIGYIISVGFYDKNNTIKAINFLILACKHDRVEILEYIFSSGMVFKNVSTIAGKNTLVPNDKDQTSHNVFYYAIRSGNTEILCVLIDKWPGNYFATRLLELDEVLSSAYEQLKLQNVSLTDEMETFITNKLINLRFFSNSSGPVQNSKDSLRCINERINLVLEKITLLKSEYSSNEKVDAKFLFIGRFIAQNIFILKRQLKLTYDRLPWEEIEFCLVAFVSSYLKQQDINLFYRATLNKSKILLYLENFATKLEDAQPFIASLDVSKLSELPKSNRELVVANIIRDCPQFSELYSDYQKIRDVHSLERVSEYLNLALSTNLKEREGQIIITRTLQVMGEYLKNTLESPKVSSTTSDLLLLSLPKNTRKIIIDLRNSLSHAYSLSKRTEIYENTNVEFFIGIQNDFKRIYNVITDILHNNKIKMMEILLKRISSSESVHEIGAILEDLNEVFSQILLKTSNSGSVHKAIFEVLGNVEPEKVMPHGFKMMEIENIEKLIEKISDCIIDKTKYEMELFKKINSIILSVKNKSKNMRADYISFNVTLFSLCTSFNDRNLDHNAVRGIKFTANKMLENFIPRVESQNLKEIVELLMIISSSAQSRIPYDHLDTIDRLMFEIFYIAELEINDIKWVAKLRKKLREKGPSGLTNKKSNSHNITMTMNKYNKHLTDKLSDLNDILNSSSGKLIAYNKNKKLQAVVEMLVLDILSILGRSEKHLENDLFFLDSSTPLPTGKSLRNHLAHGNVLLDLFLTDPSLAVVLNAKKLISENIVGSKKKIGNFVKDDPSKLNYKFDQVLTTLNNQESMFSALLNGNLEELERFLENGVDINSKCINSSTLLHFAVQQSNLNLVEFIVDHNLSINIKDAKGQTPLHIAAAHGRKNIVEFLLSQETIFVDETDKKGKTPLHLAATNGYEDTIEILLKNSANICAKDISSHLPLHYAAKNNHTKAVEILLQKAENVDIETKGGFTLLHLAAEFGCLQVVEFLLENGAMVNAKNDRHGIPLHTAALNGHLEVVIALILKGADVNAKLFDGCTSLHYAVENGHKEVARVLLEYGAEVDATDKSYNFTPLSYAAKDGYEEIVEIFMKKGANVDIATISRMTPLHFAVQSGHLNIVNILLQHGANIHARDVRNYSVLHYAAENGREKIAQFLLHNGAGIDAEGFDNVTPLHCSASKGYQKIVDILIKNGAEVNHCDFRGSTPLFAAAENGHKSVIEILLKNKVEIDSKSYDARTPLHVSALGGYYDVSVLLLEHAADVNAKDQCGRSPLHEAISNGCKEIVTLLIENGAEIEAKSVFDETPLHMAVQAGYKDLVDILIANGAKVDLESDILPLVSAIRNNDRELVEILIAKGANVDAKQGQPLSLAVLYGYRDIVDLLLKNHARVDIKGSEEETPLHLAAGKGHIEIVNALISKGADVNAKTTTSVSPLRTAAEGGHSEVVKILLVNGAMVDIGTPLHLAAAFGHVDVVDVLLSNGAKINLRDDKGRTPLELAVANGHLPVVNRFLQQSQINWESRGNNGVTLLLIAAQQNNFELVKFLVENGASTNAKNDTGSKCLHISAREGNLDSVEFFFAQGMDVNEPGAFNQTPLHYATMKNQIEVVKYLISKGANPNAKDSNGFTSMHIAALFGFKDIIKVLLENNAFFNPIDDLCRTPLKIAKNDDICCNDVYTNTPCNSKDRKDVVNLLSSTKRLFEAVKQNSLPAVEECIKAEAFINAKLIDMEATPLHYAAWKGYEEIADVLLQNKADANSKSKRGFTALHYAAQFSHLKCVKILLCYGATYNAISETGKTPVTLTSDKGIIDLFKMIDNLFKNIKNNHARLINDLNKVNNSDLKAIMNARNRQNQSLISAASQSDLNLAEELKFTSQGDAHLQFAEAVELLDKGCYQRSLTIFKRLLERRKNILGLDNSATLDMQTYVAKALYKLGDYQKSLDMLEEIFTKQKVLLGDDYIDTLDTRSMIALVMHRQDKNEEAINIYREVYSKQKKMLGPNDQNTLNTQINMALVLNALGEYEEALSMNTAVFKMRKKTLGTDHMSTILAQNNIALVLSSQRKFVEALKIYEEVLEKKKKVIGVNHPDTLRTMQSIATILVNENKIKEGLKAYEEVLNIQKKTLPQNHPEILNTKYLIGNTLFQLGKHISAFKIFKECYDLRVNVFGPCHPTVLDAYNKMEVVMKVKFKMEGTNPEEFLGCLQNEINIASSDGNLQDVERLLENGADVNDADTDGRRPLHFAVNNGHFNIVNLLLKCGADVTLVTNKGNTPLHTAVFKNNQEIVRVLLLHVSDQNKLSNRHDFINAKTISGGTTSLHIAAKLGCLEIVKLLLKNGASYNVQNNEGKTPIDIAKDPKIIELLKLIEELFKLVKRGNVEAINKLQSLKLDELMIVTNARCNQGRGLLQVAIVNKHKNVAGALLSMLKKPN